MTDTSYVRGGNKPGSGRPLRDGGKAPTSFSVSGDGDLPSTRSAQSGAQLPAVALMRDVCEGPERMREQGKIYLPQAPGENEQSYKARLALSVFFGFTDRAVEGLTGLVFAKDLKLGDDVPDPIKELCENVDNRGTHIDVFARDQMRDSMRVGHRVVLVDYTKTGGAQTAADEKSGKARPYWVEIPKENVLSWKVEYPNGELVLRQLVILEKDFISEGKFGSKPRERYRVFYNDDDGVRFELLRIAEDKRTVIIDDEGPITNQDEIPVVEIPSSGRKALFESKPPLLDMAYLNIAHYQEYSDARYARHKTNTPILVTIGVEVPEGTKLVVGADHGINIPNADGDAKYISHSGASLGDSRQACEDLKSDMGTLGLAMLAPQKRGAETAEAKRLDKSTTDSALAVSARALQDALEKLLDITAKYMKLPGGGSVVVNRDFESGVMDPAMMSAWADLASKLDIPVRVVLEQLQKYRLIAEETDLDTLESEILANQAAKHAREEALNAARAKANPQQMPIAA